MTFLNHVYFSLWKTLSRLKLNTTSLVAVINVKANLLHILFNTFYQK